MLKPSFFQRFFAFWIEDKKGMVAQNIPCPWPAYFFESEINPQEPKAHAD